MSAKSNVRDGKVGPVNQSTGYDEAGPVSQDGDPDPKAEYPPEPSVPDDRGSQIGQRDQSPDMNKRV